MFTAGPYALSLGTRVTLTTPEHGADRVILTNLSPFSCRVEVSGTAPWLSPWTERLYAIPDGASLYVTPQLVLAGASTDATLLATWVDAGDRLPAASYPAPLTSQAIAAAVSGSVTALQQPHVGFTDSPWQFAVNSTHTFAVPAGAPPLSDVLIAYSTLSGSAAMRVSAKGHTSGIAYLPNTNMAQGSLITCPFSSTADPGGLDVTVTYLGTGAGGAGTLEVIGLIYPATVRPYYGTAGTQGPTNFADAAVSAAVLVNPGSAAAIIRVWSAWCSAANAAAAAAGECNVQLNGVRLVACQAPLTIAGGAGSGGANAVNFPGGLPIAMNLNAIVLSFNTSAGRGGCAWSVDVA